MKNLNPFLQGMFCGLLAFLLLAAVVETVKYMAKKPAAEVARKNDKPSQEQAEIVEKASIEHKCELKNVRIVKHYKAKKRYCVEVCGKYQWYEPIWTSANLSGDLDCSWLVKNSHAEVVK